jgi:hypothetical protein
MKIRTYTHPARRALRAADDLMNKYQWLPMVIALCLLLLVNSTLFD